MILDENAIPEIAQSDIVCYKVLQVGLDRIGGTYKRTTLFRYVEIPQNILDGEGNFYAMKESDDVDVKYGDVYGYFGYNYQHPYIDSGFIHTYEDFDDVRRIVREIELSTLASLEIYECVIPAGTVFYAGIDSRDRVYAYASKSIRFIHRKDFNNNDI